MASKRFLYVAIFCFLISSFSGQAQDPQPSLADVARQTRKDKEKNASRPKTVITNEGLPSSSGLAGLTAAEQGASPNSGTGDPLAQARAGFDQAQSELNKLDGMDRATLAKTVLRDNDIQFPNRRSWEDRLFAAKNHYVSHGRELIVELQQILGELQSLKQAQDGAKLSSSDPRAQQMKQRLQQIVQDAAATEQSYRAIVLEGQDLAKQAKP